MKSILYPIFLACRDNSADLFWKKIFGNLAFGDTPKGIQFKGTTLCSTVKKKEFVYSFADKSPSLIYIELYEILSKTFGIKTDLQYSKSKIMFNDYRETNSSKKESNSWTSVRRKSVRENMLQEFCIRMEKIHGFGKENMKHLYHVLFSGIIFKVFTSIDIKLSNGIIENINGIRFDNRNVIIERAITAPIVKKPAPPGIYLWDLWNDYIKESAK